MAKQGDQEGARLLSNVIRPGNRSIRAPNELDGSVDRQATLLKPWVPT
jgi:hypothetical protein